MSKASPKPPKKKVQSLNRWRISALSILQMVLLGMILLAVNYLSIHHFYRYDASRGQDYSLSSSTRKYLASPVIQKREKPIRWILAYRRSSPFYERVRALAEEYARLSKGKITLTLVDPLRDPDRMQEINAAYNITLIRDLMILDARNDDSAVTTESKDRVKTLNPNIKIVPAEQMITFSTASGERKVSGFQGEDMLTARLVESIEGKPRKMALIADKSRIGTRETNKSRATLEDILRFQNIEVQELKIAEIKAIPESIDGILLVAPKYDFTEAEIQILEAYWNRPRSAVLVLIDQDGAPPHLRAFLRSYGVTAQNDRVVTIGKNGLSSTAMAEFTEGTPFTADLARQTTEFGGASSSLAIREGAEDLLNRKIFPVGLLQASPGFYGESNFGTGKESFDEREDHAPPIHLAASVTRGAQADDRFAADTSRMVVISNTDFLDPAYHRAENLDFLASSANWLIGRESLSGTSPRSLTTYKLPLLKAQMSFINRCNLIFLPAVIVLFGAFVWSSRRA